MEQQAALDQFCQVLTQTGDVLKALTQMEQKKANAASEKQHQLMDGFLKEEQALILKLRGLEQRRIKLMDGLGFQGLRFRQILEQASPELQELLSPYFTMLTEEAAQLTQAKEAADRIIKVRLREIESITASGQGMNYESDGGITQKFPSHFKDTYV